jgi:hypothetical protein
MVYQRRKDNVVQDRNNFVKKNVWIKKSSKINCILILNFTAHYGHLYKIESLSDFIHGIPVWK